MPWFSGGFVFFSMAAAYWAQRLCLTQCYHYFYSSTTEQLKSLFSNRPQLSLPSPKSDPPRAAEGVNPLCVLQQMGKCFPLMLLNTLLKNAWS